MIRHISAVTHAVNDMARSVEFYRKLGFELLYGGECATFSSLRAGEAFVNLIIARQSLPVALCTYRKLALNSRSQHRSCVRFEF